MNKNKLLDTAQKAEPRLLGLSKAQEKLNVHICTLILLDNKPTPEGDGETEKTIFQASRISKGFLTAYQHDGRGIRKLLKCSRRDCVAWICQQHWT